MANKKEKKDKSTKTTKNTKSIEVKIIGQGKRGIFVIGKSNSSRNIQRELFLKNIELTNDCFCMAVPAKLRGSQKKEFKEELNKKIIELNVNHILVFGEKALKFLYGGRLTGLGIATYRANIIPDKLYNAFVCPLLDPVEVDIAFNQNLLSVANRDLQKVINHLGIPFPSIPNPADLVTVCLDYEPLIARLENILVTKPLISYDYETTGIKPWNFGHKIVSIGIATREEVFAFPFQYKWWTEDQYKEIKKLWIKILKNKEILKVAQNANFEQLWERVILDVETNGIIWDTMLSSHILDSRSRIAGLKHQAFIHFGIENYNKDAEKYIKAKDNNSLNNMMNMPVDQLCIYNGTDSLVTLWLRMKQRKESTMRDLTEANNLFLDGAKAFLDAQLNGIRIDVEYYKKIEQHLELKLIEIEGKIENNKSIKDFEKEYGYEINLGSTKDLRILFFEMLKIKSIKKTKKKLQSVDAETLEKIDHLLAKLIVEKRKLLKLKDTYIGQILRENNDGYIHPFFHLDICTSFRSSSSAINFQNMPNHDEEAKKMIRGGIYPHPGHHLVEIDYSAAEIKTAGCVTLDPILLEYILDESTDMHRDQAEEIWLCKDEAVSKPMRQSSKNELVFPQLYKAWFGTCANMLWQSSQKLKFSNGISVLEHFREIGVTTFNQFKEHIKNVCYKFWDRFPVIQEWQNQMINEYQETGMIKTVTGFQCTSVLTENMCCNYPIQGPSFHCLLWSMIRLNKKLKEGNYKSKIMGQVHDSLVLSVPPEETKIVLPMTRRIITNDMKKANSWVIVPFVADLEIAPVDRPWSEKKSAKWEDYE